MSGYWPTVPWEHPDHFAPDPCDTCDGEPCICDTLTDEARDEGL